MSEKIAVGIDLGTTFSCVAVFQNGKPVVIPNGQGDRITPSYVSFTDTDKLVGKVAKNKQMRNLTNTIFDAKRFIGRKFQDQGIQDGLKTWPFQIVDVDGRPKFCVKVKGQDQMFAPEEISSMVLRQMKETAEAYLGQPVTDVVITVPADFNNAKREATKLAARLAHLNVLRIVNEPTAAALAYGLDKGFDRRVVLVFDLGGGTVDVSILTIRNGLFNVESTAGDPNLGGQDFDNRMVEYFAKEFQLQHNVDLSGDVKALGKLKTACEKAKVTLSAALEASEEIENLCEGIEFEVTLTRARFNEINDDLFRKTLEPVKKALETAEMDKSKIDDIVIVGGSTRIVKIQELLEEFFGGKKLNKSVNADEAVALGASIQAAIILAVPELQQVVLLDVTPLSLGVEYGRGFMSFLIRRNATLPTRQTKQYTTAEDDQESVKIKIFEGERPMTSENSLLGSFKLRGIRKAPKRVPKIVVTFEVDVDGILKVSAMDNDTQQVMNIEVNLCGRSTDDEIDEMLKVAQIYKKKDQVVKHKIEAVHRLETYCFYTKNKLKGKRDNGIITDGIYTIMAGKCDEALEWSKAMHNISNAQEFNEKMRQLKSLCDPIMFASDTRGEKQPCKKRKVESTFRDPNPDDGNNCDVEEVDLTADDDKEKEKIDEAKGENMELEGNIVYEQGTEERNATIQNSNVMQGEQSSIQDSNLNQGVEANQTESGDGSSAGD